jgi:hypothetical protein
MPTASPELSGDALLHAFQVATDHLTSRAAAIDAINVYPVPDGDTGSNMAATMREACRQAHSSPGPHTAASVLRSLARGALFGARGNSGVILSQALRGLASIDAGDALRPATLQDALRAASTAAYAAVTHPVEGTMLTVLRAAADGAAAVPPGSGLASTLDAAVTAAEAAEAATPTQLPALAEAGVTDSGGEGVCTILRGLAASISGRPLGAEPPAALSAPVAAHAGHEAEGFGFCTEFIIEPLGGPVDIEAVRRFAARGEVRSAVVVGDAAAVRVHVHVDEPDRFLAGAAGFGRVTRLKVEDMSAQHGRFVEAGSGAGAKVALLALSPGPGFDDLFRSLGAAVAPLGELVKPAAGDIAAAADALRVADVIVLPNHRNVLMAARQAVALASCTLHVVPSETLPQGVAAAIAFDGQRDAADNALELAEALRAVMTIEVTTAAADRTAAGISVKAGDAIALINGRLVGKSRDPFDALLGALNRFADDGEGLITLYAGRDLDDGTLGSWCARVRERFPAATVEARRGDQALYPVIASIER